MKALQLEHSVDEHLKPIKDADNIPTSMEVSTNKLRVKAFESDSLTIANSTKITSILDEDDMVSGLDTALSTQQAIKNFVNSTPLSGAFSKTAIKVMPMEFFSNDDRGSAYAIVEDDTADTLGVRVGHGAVELYAFVKIPNNYIATAVAVFASASTSNAVEVYSFNYNTGATVSKGSGDFNASVDFTDVTSDRYMDLVIKLIPALTGTTIYGAEVSIESE